MMSLYRWFLSASSKLYLPDPSKEETKKKEDEVAKANTKVAEAIAIVLFCILVLKAHFSKSLKYKDVL